MTTTAPPANRFQVTALQRRTVRVLVAVQVLGGIGVAVGHSVGALLLARIAGGLGASGLAQSAAAVGGALLAIPVTRLTQARGRRWGLAVAYGAAVIGGLLVVTAAVSDSTVLAIAGMFLFGGGASANLQARYAAVDLAEPVRRGRELSVVVWATTVGAVAGPNLSAPADELLRGYGVPPLSGPFLFSVVAFTVAAVMLVVLLRPDPLLLARRLTVEASEPQGRARTMRGAVKEVRRNRTALLGISAVAIGHAVMFSVMVMTPVHIDAVLSAGHHSGAANRDLLVAVGVVLSLHVAGMFALSPVVGYACDRYGPRTVVLAGALLLTIACVLAGTSGADTVRLSAGLFLLGLGWSCTMVAGSTMLTESVAVAIRPSAQGLCDLTMGLAGAFAGALSGVVVAWTSYPALALAAGLIAVPLAVVAARPGRIVEPPVVGGMR